MTKLMSITNPPSPLIRRYDNFAGVDFSRMPSQVDSNRSPDAKNVYKDYRCTTAPAVQTRPGYRRVTKCDSRIYGIHVLSGKVLIHHGNKLSIANGFPSDTILNDTGFTMNEQASVSFIFKEKLYILDGINYLVYDSTLVREVKNEAFIPTTKISSSPNGQNAQYYQDVNLLTPLRNNSFSSDGVSTTYKLDVDSFDNITPRVWVNSSEITSGFTYDFSNGTITFTQAPSCPLTEGTDNVVIRFSKTISGNIDKITKCTSACVFDNRVFLSSNSEYKGIVFHSELNDPTYFSDESWYDDGSDNCDIKAIIPLGELLAVIKSAYPFTSMSKVYYHTPSLDYDAGKVYPSNDAGIAVGGLSQAAVFKDGIVYLSSFGLEEVSIGQNKACLYHRSENIDSLLINDTYLSQSVMQVWRNYLCVLVKGRMFLADGNNIKTKNSSETYDWYLWEGIGDYSNDAFFSACLLKTIDDKLYFGCENGALCVFEGTNDEGRAINAYWCMPQDVFKNLSHYKTTNRRGGVAVVKRIPNSIIKIAAASDRESFSDIAVSKTSGFKFTQTDFAKFSFGTGVRANITFGLKKKKIRYLQLKFYSDELNKPFGLYEVYTEAYVGNYIK